MIFRSSIHFQDIRIFTCPLSRSPDLFHSSFATSLELPILVFFLFPSYCNNRPNFFLLKLGVFLLCEELTMSLYISE